VEREVLLQERWGVLPAEDTQGLVEGLDREMGIEAVEGGAEA
jgi:hypothetical protein